MGPLDWKREPTRSPRTERREAFTVAGMAIPRPVKMHMVSMATGSQKATKWKITVRQLLWEVSPLRQRNRFGRIFQDLPAGVSQGTGICDYHW